MSQDNIKPIAALDSLYQRIIGPLQEKVKPLSEEIQAVNALTLIIKDLIDDQCEHECAECKKVNEGLQELIDKKDEKS